MEFYPITLQDRNLFERAYRCCRHEGSESSFTNLFIWRKPLDIVWTVVGKALCVIVRNDGPVMVAFWSNSGVLRIGLSIWIWPEAPETIGVPTWQRLQASRRHGETFSSLQPVQWALLVLLRLLGHLSTR